MSMEAMTLALYGHLCVQVMDLFFLNISSTINFKSKKQTQSVGISVLLRSGTKE